MCQDIAHVDATDVDQDVDPWICLDLRHHPLDRPPSELGEDRSEPRANVGPKGGRAEARERAQRTILQSGSPPWLKQIP